MTTNRLAKSTAEHGERIIPPKDKAERVRFWLDRGNASLREKGMHHLEWRWDERSDSYSIVNIVDHRAEMQMLANRDRDIRDGLIKITKR